MLHERFSKISPLHVYLQNEIKPQHILDEDYTIIITSEASGRNI